MARENLGPNFSLNQVREIALRAQDRLIQSNGTSKPRLYERLCLSFYHHRGISPEMAIPLSSALTADENPQSH